MQVVLTVEINTFTHVDAIHSLHAGGYAGSQKYIDDCKFSVSVEKTEEECSYMAAVVDRLMFYSIPFTVSYI